MNKRIKLQLNSNSNLKEVLQEIYNLTDELILQVQNEITKMSNSTRLQDEVLDSRTKYAKAINDLLNTKEKAIAKKLDVAKVLQEVIKYNGDLSKASEGGNISSSTFDITKIRDIVNNKNQETKEVQTIQLNK